MTFSRHLLQTTVGILAALILVLLLLVVGYFERFAGQPYADVDAFIPIDRVERLSQLVTVLRAPSLATSQDLKGSLAKTNPGLWAGLPWVGSAEQLSRSYALSCPVRQQEILVGRLANQLGLTRSEVEGRLGLAFASWVAQGATGCRAFFVDVDLVMRSDYLFDPLRPLSGASLVQSLSLLLTERVAWDAKPPCLRLRASDQRQIYLKGPAGYCLQEEMGLGSELAFAGVSRELINFVYSRLFVAEAVRDSSLEARSLELTLHPTIQSLLDGYGDCLSDRIDCPWPAWPNASLHQTAVVVIMDPNNQRLVGLRCFGQCSGSSGFSSQMNQAIAPITLTVPPASIAKLFYALALSEALPQSAATHRELAFQVKTSGQLDRRSRKRNEWWERLALCDLTSRSDPGQVIQCSIARRAQALATELGWNQYCQAGDDNCGRVQLSGTSSELKGYAGYFRSLPPAGSAGGSGAAVLNWSTYNQIRDAGGITQIREPYFAASAAVQSVLGAGDNRVSALGLASLAGQIERMSRGMAPLSPVLVVASTVQPQQGAALRQLRQQRAARQVRDAMAKVMTGPEPGWDGAGTGHSAFRASFQQACKAPCAVQAKTGTVSRQDPRFAGTTTFSAIVEVNRLRRQIREADGSMGSQEPLPRDAIDALPSVLTLGVITIPIENKRPLPGGHGASRFGMQVVHDLVVSRRGNGD